MKCFTVKNGDILRAKITAFLLWGEDGRHGCFVKNDYITVINGAEGIRDNEYSSKCVTILLNGVLYELHTHFITADSFERICDVA